MDRDEHIDWTTANLHTLLDPRGLKTIAEHEDELFRKPHAIQQY